MPAPKAPVTPPLTAATPTQAAVPSSAAPAAAVSSNKTVAAALRAQKHKRPTTVPPAVAEGVSDLDAQPVPAASATAIAPPGQRMKVANRTKPAPQRRGAANMFPAYHGGHPKSPPYPPVGDPVQHQAFLATPNKRFQPQPPPPPRQQDRPYQPNFSFLIGSQEIDMAGQHFCMRMQDALHCMHAIYDRLPGRHTNVFLSASKMPLPRLCRPTKLRFKPPCRPCDPGCHTTCVLEI